MTSSRTPSERDSEPGRGNDGKLPLSILEHVRQGLRDEIIDGTLSPGERVNEEMVARAYGVSRTPIREAMRSLESEGLIAHQRGRGATVAELATTRDATVLYRVRIIVESALARRASERISASELERLAGIQSSFRRLALSAANREADLRELVALDAGFHMGIYHAAEASLLLAIVTNYWGQLMRELKRQDHDAEHPVRFVMADDRSLQQHDRLLEALSSRDGDLAESAMAEHLHGVWRVIQATSV